MENGRRDSESGTADTQNIFLVSMAERDWWLGCVEFELGVAIWFKSIVNHGITSCR